MTIDLMRYGQRVVLPLGLLVLAYSFWRSPHVQAIAAGVAIFLFGMLSLEQGFKIFNGGVFERVLHAATKDLKRSIAFGMVATTLMQSSSLVSVLTISFLSAELMSLAAGIGIIFGANLGTTTGAWLIAGLGLKVEISAFAMPLLVFGVILVFQKARGLRGLGYALTGVGLLFLGIHEMKEGFEAFKSTLDLSAYAVGGLQGLLLYTAIGVAATVIMQSSHATLVLTITALSAQQVSYENALALAIGSNLGTTISAIIGAMGANVQGRRLAGAHVVFNLMTGIVAILFMAPMIQLVSLISDGVGIAQDDYTLKLAVFHSVFNVLGLILMVPWTKQLVSVLNRVFKPTTVAFEQPKYLSESANQLPETALQALRQESIRLYERSAGIIAHGIGVHRHNLAGPYDAEHVIRQAKRSFSENVEERYERGIKSLYAAIVEYSGLVPVAGQAENAENVHALRHACRDLVEAVKALKHLQKNLLVQMRSSNRKLRDRYDAQRLQILMTLRDIEAFRAQPQDALTVSSLDGARLRLKQAAWLDDDMLDELIRGHRIDAKAASSLMKDAEYVRLISSKLLDAASVLFGSPDGAVTH